MLQIDFKVGGRPSSVDMSVGKASIIHGKSAYEIALGNGYEGTEQEWLKSLHGKDGESAYQIAKDNGFVGTEEEWLASLHGAPFTYEDFTPEQLESLTGPAGNDGYTPVKGKDYFDGADGKDGLDGAPGKDGYTPVKGVDYFDGADGKDGQDGYTPQKGVDYFDGQDGADGKDGADGHTPVKGTDYWTESDKTEMVNDVLAALPVYAGEVESV